MRYHRFFQFLLFSWRCVLVAAAVVLVVVVTIELPYYAKLVVEPFTGSFDN